MDQSGKELFGGVFSFRASTPGLSAIKVCPHRGEDLKLHRTMGALQEPCPRAVGDIARDRVGRELSVAAQSFPASHVSLPEKSLYRTEH